MSQQIAVDHRALGDLLRAICGQEHEIRELLATMDTPLSEGEPPNPLTLLISQFNDTSLIVRESEGSELEQAKEVLSEAYVIAGELLSELGQMDSDRGTKLLDNLAEGKLVHRDLLPWEYFNPKTDVAQVGLGVEQFVQDHLDQHAAMGHKVESSTLPMVVGGLSPTGPERMNVPVDATYHTATNEAGRTVVTGVTATEATTAAQFKPLELGTMFPPVQMYPTTDPKYGILNNQLVNAASLKAIKDPLFIFRSQDRHLPAVLEFYLSLIRNSMHVFAVNQRRREIVEWQQTFPYLLKEPDTVLPR